MEANSIKEVRESRGCSQVAAAVLAGISINTWRTFEVAPAAVTSKKRQVCERALEAIRGKAAA